MKNSLILHWRGWNTNENWFPWLKEELKKLNYEVFAPNLPNTSSPKLSEQLSFIDLYSKNLKDNSLIFWHSLWCSLALNFINKHQINNSTIFLVAPVYYWLAKDIWKEMLKYKYDILDQYFNSFSDFETVNNLNNKYIVLLSEDDPYINFEKAKKFYKNLKRVTFIEFIDKWHFNKASNTTKIEEIIDFLK